MNFILNVTILVLCFVKISAYNHGESAITFKLNGGRFGDCIKNYVQAKWIARHHKIPFYFRLFPHSNVLMANSLENIFTEEIEKKYTQKFCLNAAREVVKKTEACLFISQLGTGIYLPERQFGLYEEILKNEEFGREIKKMLQTSVPVHELDLPENKITVAVHVRKGTNYDGKLSSAQLYQGHENWVSYNYYPLQLEPEKNENCKNLMLQKDVLKIEKIDAPLKKATKRSARFIKKKRNPDKGNHATKFPPEQFYIDQVKMLSELLGHKPLYVYIFTDFPNPSQLANTFREQINLPNIEFATNTNNSYKQTFVDDFYNMARFDCLIRPLSSFSWAAQLIGNHSVIIYPDGARWYGNRLIMTKVAIIHRIASFEQ